VSLLGSVCTISRYDPPGWVRAISVAGPVRTPGITSFLCHSSRRQGPTTSSRCQLTTLATIDIPRSTSELFSPASRKRDLRCI
jgi:hypothetical protein